MSRAHGAMVRGSRARPGLDESLGAEAKPISAVRVPYLEGRPRNRLPLGDEEGDAAGSAVDNREERHGTLPDPHLDRETFPRLAVVDRERHEGDRSLGDGGMGWPVMAKEDHVRGKVHRVEFGEATARPRKAHDLHRLGVFHFAFSGYGYPFRREQAVAGDDRGDDVLVVVPRGALVIIRQRAEVVLLNKSVERAGRSGGALYLERGTLGETSKEAENSRIFLATSSLSIASRRDFISHISRISKCVPKTACCRVRSV